MRALLDEKLHIGDARERGIFRKNLASHVDTGAVWLFFEQEIENYAATFIYKVAILQDRGS